MYGGVFLTANIDVADDNKEALYDNGALEHRDIWFNGNNIILSIFPHTNMCVGLKVGYRF